MVGWKLCYEKSIFVWSIYVYESRNPSLKLNLLQSISIKPHLVAALIECYYWFLIQMYSTYFNTNIPHNCCTVLLPCLAKKTLLTLIVDRFLWLQLSFRVCLLRSWRPRIRYSIGDDKFAITGITKKTKNSIADFNSIQWSQ